MPFRRRPVRRFRKPVRRIRRTIRRFRRRVPRGIGRVYNFVQTTSLLPIIDVTAGAEKFFSFIFRLSDLGNSPTGNADVFTNLFDNYRLNAVKLMLFPNFNQVNAASTTISLPQIVTVLDFDDANVPTQVNTLDQYQSVRRTTATRMHVRFLKPRAQHTGVSVSGGTTGNLQVPKKTWFDIADPGINFYGVKGCVTSSNGTEIPAFQIKVIAKYYFQFRNVR